MVLLHWIMTAFVGLIAVAFAFLVIAWGPAPMLFRVLNHHDRTPGRWWLLRVLFP